MGLLEDCKNHFGTDDLYAVLGVKKEASESQVKSAYRKLSLKVHPDRAPDDKKDEATKKFQVLHKVHFILSTKESKELYDETGTVLDDDSLNSKANWNDYWRLLFPKITTKDINEFINKYKGSKEEEEDIIKYYNRYNGDMDKLSECIIGFEEERVAQLINEMISQGKLEKFDEFVNEPEVKKKKRIARAEKERKQFEKESKKRKKKGEGDGDDDLVKAIQLRSKSNFDDLISNLEAKYVNGKGKSSKRQKKK